MAETVQIVSSPNFVVVINHEMGGNAAGFNVNVNNTGFSVIAGVLLPAEPIGGEEFTQIEKDKLAAIEVLAKDDLTGPEIKVLYEGEASAFTDSQFTKLAGIDANATDDQTGAEIKALYEQRSMAFTDVQWTKLQGIDAVATDDQTGAEIKNLYENEANTNEFNDAEKASLATMEDNATADQTDAEIRQAVENATDSNVFTDNDHSKLDGIEAADNDWTGANDFQNTFALSGELQPPTLTASVNNYEPTGIEIKTVLRLVSDATWSITGIAGGFSGRILTLTNSGQNNIVLDHDSASSITVNRFSLASGDRTLFPGESVMLRYDGTENLWHNINDAMPIDMDGATIKTLYESEADTNAFDDAAVSKLAAIEASATADQTDAEIRTAVAAATDSNVFTDSEKASLATMEDNSTADQTNAEIRTAVAAATDSNVYTDAEKAELAAIEASATADQTDAEIRAAVANATDSNVFQDADVTKLDAIETGATVDQTDSEIEIAYNAQVAQVSAQEILDGTEAAIRRFSPDDIDAMVAAHKTPLNSQTGLTYTLTASDTDGIVEMNNAAENEVTIPLNADVPYNLGTIISISMMGAGVTLVSSDIGVTLNGVIDGQIAMVNQYDAVSMYKRATDEWVIQGGGSLLTDWWSTLTVGGVDPGLAIQYRRVEGGRYMVGGALKTLGEILNFTRASDGTFYNAAGVMQTGSTNVERMEHNPVTGENLGLVQENSHTNEIIQSEDYSTTWTGSALITTNTTVAPDGTTTADKIEDDDAGGSEQIVSNTITVANSETWCFSKFILKDAIAPATRFPLFRLRYTGGTNTQLDLNIDTQSGAVNPVVFSGGGTIEASGVEDHDEYWRFWIAAKNDATGNTSLKVEVYPAIGGNADLTTHSNTPTGSIVAWGSQLEESKYPTRYIKTTTAAATRVRDTITVTPDGALPHTGYHATDNTIVVEFMLPTIIGGNQQIFSYGINGTNRIAVYMATGGLMKMFAQFEGSTQTNVTFGTATAGVWNKIAMQWNATDLRASFNGATAVTGTGNTFPDAINLIFGIKQAGGNNVESIHWSSFVQYPSYFSQAQLEALSA